MDSATPAGPTPIEIPKAADIRGRAEREHTGWSARLPKSGPRLFFDSKSWQSLRRRAAATEGLAFCYFDDARHNARQIAREPVPVYRSPAEMSRATGLTAFDAAQELWQRVVGNHLVVLAFGLALDDDSAIRAKLRETVLMVCTYPHWGECLGKPNQDLAAGHIARGLAVALDWHPGLWSVEERRSVLETLRSRVERLKSSAYGSTYWAGHYDENHNHVCVAAIGLCGLAFLDEIPEAAEWTALALDNFERVARTMNADGSSNEGVPYWSYGLSYIFQYIEGVRHVLGTERLYEAETFRNSIKNRLHASTPDLSAAMQWGDAPPRDYYGPHHILYRLATEYRDGAGQFLASHLPFRPGKNDGHEDVVWTALWFDPSLPERRPEALDHHAPQAGIVTSRNGWKDGDYLFCIKAGYTNRNHSHLDAGAISFCIGSDWLLRTPGYGTGKGQPAFWDKAGGRWEFFSNSTESHCTLLVNGRNQCFTHDARGVIDIFDTSEPVFHAGADLTGAYAGVTCVRRDVFHRRGEYILVVDRITTPDDATVAWLAQVPPGTSVSDERITITSRRGSLEVRSLVPGGRFAARSPTSRHVDVDSKIHQTFAVTQTGRVIRFATILLPRLEGRPSGVRDVAARVDGGRSGYTVAGTDWQDTIMVDPAATVAASLQTRREK